MHRETKKSFDPFYCNICFIAVVWNQTHSTSKVCLYKTTSTTNRDSFTVPFQFGSLFFPFLAKLTWLQFQYNAEKQWRNWHPCFVPEPWKFSVVQHLEWYPYFCHIEPSTFRKYPSSPSLWCCITETCWIWQLFSVPTKMIMRGFTFILVMWCITLIFLWWATLAFMK